MHWFKEPPQVTYLRFSRRRTMAAAAEGGDMTDIRAERRRVRVRDVIAKLSKKEEVVNILNLKKCRLLTKHKYGASKCGDDHLEDSSV